MRFDLLLDLLQPCTGISILDFELFPELPGLRNAWRLRRVRGEEELHGTIELVFVELPKFGRDPSADRRTPLGRWLHVLKFGAEVLTSKESDEKSDLLAEEGIIMAINELERINADRVMRDRIEAREKWVHDHATRMAQARREGLAEGEAKGRAEGRAEERRSLAARLLRAGQSVEQVADLLGMPIDEVRALG